MQGRQLAYREVGALAVAQATATIATAAAKLCLAEHEIRHRQRQSMCRGWGVVKQGCLCHGKWQQPQAILSRGGLRARLADDGSFEG